jgi:hypothetical protein
VTINRGDKGRTQKKVKSMLSTNQESRNWQYIAPFGIDRVQHHLRNGRLIHIHKPFAIETPNPMEALRDLEDVDAQKPRLATAKALSGFLNQTQLGIRRGHRQPKTNP